MVTTEFFVAFEFAFGDCEITVPLATVSLDASFTSGMKLLVFNNDSAAACVRPTTSGTVPSPMPELTVISTVEPLAALVLPFGVCSNTWFAGTVSLATFLTDTLKPAVLRVFVASVTSLVVTSGTLTFSVDLPMLEPTKNKMSPISTSAPMVRPTYKPVRFFSGGTA